VSRPAIAALIANWKPHIRTSPAVLATTSLRYRLTPAFPRHLAAGRYAAGVVSSSDGLAQAAKSR
jgi:hypothetical protein